jgi:hypothetical protein
LDPDSTIELVGRLDGPLHFRFLLQPLVAAIIGYRDGVRDAKAGAPPYFGMLTQVDREQRKVMFHDAWSSIGKVFILAFVLDCTFQYLAYKSVGMIVAAVIAAVLAIVPYLIFRGLVNRMISRK